MEKKGPDIYLLDNGQIWNASHSSVRPELTADAAPDKTTDCTMSETDGVSNSTPDYRPRSTRVKIPPSWTEDFVLEK